MTKAHGRPVGVSGCTKDNIHWKSLSVYGSVMRLLQVSSARGESACDWRPTAKHFHLVTDERLTVRPPLRLVGPLRVEANRTTRGGRSEGISSNAREHSAPNQAKTQLAKEPKLLVLVFHIHTKGHNWRGHFIHIGRALTSLKLM